MANFNWVDYVLLAIFFVNILSGFARGLVKEVVSLITLAAAFIIAIMFSNALATAFTSSSTVQNAVNQASTSIGVNAAQPVSYLALGLSFALLFAGTIIAGAILSSILNIAFQTGILGIGNRLLGGVFGFFRGFIINLVLIFLVQLTPLSAQAWWQQSQIVVSYQPAVAWLAGVVSPSLAGLKEKLGQTIQKMGSQVQDMTNSMPAFNR